MLEQQMAALECEIRMSLPQWHEGRRLWLWWGKVCMRITRVEQSIIQYRSYGASGDYNRASNDGVGIRNTNESASMA
jgi:hypothetical protein